MLLLALPAVDQRVLVPAIGMPRHCSACRSMQHATCFLQFDPRAAAGICVSIGRIGLDHACLYNAASCSMLLHLASPDSSSSV